MKTIKPADLSSSDTIRQMSKCLQNGGLVCVPCRGTYRILADLTNEDAVINLMQSKRKTSKSPSLVFIKNMAALADVVESVDPLVEKIAADFWPGPLTILFYPSDSIPKKVAKQLTKANGHIGVRMPDDDLVQQLLEAFGGPLLVSSANKEKRHGESSPAQVRKTFVSQVDFFVDEGDLVPHSASTIIGVHDGAIEIKREGAITAEQLSRYT